ncbi:hypothetical protein DV515_00017017 [Chloebia gouldiae]|uniref:Uncharacterized protein n=1 Tax=Chloebia gouldiae TaxID=44316 RepID=A0A3L8R9W9_CHLGU|nr:hypothetical protein DV515_00017017 [Chloebia gouldiae]
MELRICLNGRGSFQGVLFSSSFSRTMWSPGPARTQVLKAQHHFPAFREEGSYFCYDNPAALQTQVQRDMQVSTAQFMALYAWYSWPNVVLCFFGGFLLDRVFGVR